MNDTAQLASAIFSGHVVHKRLNPKRHGFRYNVFALNLDVDEIDLHAANLRLFSRNKFNVVSFHDADHGRGDGRPVGAYIRATLAAAGMTAASARITLLCYPRLFGFVFNPLSVYFCYATDGRLGAIVYEVSNTFRERTSYIIAVDQGIYAPAAQCVSQSCAKEMCVSPFTARHGQYAFHVAAPERNVVVGIALRDATGPILKTHFRGTRRALSDRGLVAMLVRHPLMTIKVFAAIHFEAARLWIKGVPLVRRRQSAEHAVHVVGSVTRTSVHA